MIWTNFNFKRIVLRVFISWEYLRANNVKLNYRINIIIHYYLFQDSEILSLCSSFIAY